MLLVTGLLKLPDLVKDHSFMVVHHLVCRLDLNNMETRMNITKLSCYLLWRKFISELEHGRKFDTLVFQVFLELWVDVPTFRSSSNSNLNL